MLKNLFFIILSAMVFVFLMILDCLFDLQSLFSSSNRGGKPPFPGPDHFKFHSGGSNDFGGFDGFGGDCDCSGGDCDCGGGDCGGGGDCSGD